MKKEIIETKHKDIYYCDECNHEAIASYRCLICKKDLCEEHVQYDTRDDSDYPGKYCKRCWEIGKPFRQKQDEALVKFNSIYEYLILNWKNECLKND